MHASSRLAKPILSAVAVMVLALLSTPGMPAASKPLAHLQPQVSFALWQLPEQTPSQMMSYVLRTASGRLIVIDGGTSGDAPYLRGFLAALGNKVEAWFITHPHADHASALVCILNRPGSLKIETIYASCPDEDWSRRNVPGELPTVQGVNAALRDAHRTAIELTLGARLRFDSVLVEVLGVKNPEITANALNNSSAVLRVSDSRKSVLFLGDLGEEGGKKLLNGRFRNRLRADYVQMAHHGQNGVTEDVYRVISPSYCLWPTPLWLWDNDGGKGRGSGPWRTLEVRSWTDKLHVKKHYVTALDGLSRID